MGWNERAQARMAGGLSGTRSPEDGRWLAYTLGDLAQLNQIETESALERLLQAAGADAENHRRAFSYVHDSAEGARSEEAVWGHAYGIRISEILDVAGLAPNAQGVFTPGEIRSLIRKVGKGVPASARRVRGRGFGGFSGIDRKGYTHYVVLPSGKIESGYDSREDAVYQQQELKDELQLPVKVLGRRALAGRGFDPAQDSSWHTESSMPQGQGLSGAASRRPFAPKGEAAWPSAYTHFVVLDGKVDSGWEYKEDAQDRADEIREFEGGAPRGRGRLPKVLTRTGVNRGGHNWGTP